MTHYTVQRFTRLGSLLLSVGLAAGALALALWKTKYGIEVYDEPLYLIPGFKLLPLGDKPIVTEVANAARQHDLLNYFLVHPWLSWSVLGLRQAAVLFGALVLGIYTWTVGRRQITAGLVIAFALMLTYDLVLTYSWSHNCWIRNLFLIHSAFLLVAFRMGPRGGELAMSFAAGIFAGLSTVAYLPSLVVFVAVALLFAVLSKIWDKTYRKPLFYICGMALVLVPFGLHLAKPEVFADWQFGFHTVVSTGSYQHNSSLQKVFAILLWLFSRPELWALGALFILEIKKVSERISPNTKTALQIIAFAIMAAHFTYRMSQSLPQKNYWLLGSFVAYGVVGGLVVSIVGMVRKNTPSTVVGVSTLLLSAVVAMSSEGAQGSMPWILPATILPLIAFGMTLSTRIKTILISHLSLVLIAAVYLKGTQTYGDVAVEECDTEITAAPLTGIKTSYRRAFLLEKLSSLAHGKHFALSYARMPVVFYFSNLIPAMGTTIIEKETSHQVLSQVLARAIELNRMPEMLFKMRQIGWEWGKNEIFLEQYPPGYRLDEFVECAAKKRVAAYTEFEAYELDRKKVRECLSPNPKVAVTSFPK